MSTPGDEAQRELERRALRKVRLLVEYMENTDEADEKTQRRLLVGLIAGMLVLALTIGALLFLTRAGKPPVVIDPAKLPPVHGGPGR